MGNRAVIAASERSNAPAIYLHWNGGPESVLAFLAAAKELGFRCPTQDEPYGMAYLQALVAIFFGDGLGTGIGPLEESDVDNGDNGLYILGPGWTVKARKHAPKGDAAKTYEELSTDAKEKHDNIKALLVKMWGAAQNWQGEQQ